MIVEKETVVLEVKEGIAYLSINMPPANKMTPQFLVEIVEVIEENVLQTEAKGVIISGKGRHFSSGADVTKLLLFIHEQLQYENGAITGYPKWYESCKAAFLSLNEMQIPVVSAIRGFCIGSGMELALSGHIRICEKGARLGLPESTFGILPGVNGTLRMYEESGLRRGLEMVLRGELFTAEEAPAGVVDCVVGKKEALCYAEQFIQYVVERKIVYSRKNAKKIFQEFIRESEAREK